MVEVDVSLREALEIYASPDALQAYLPFKPYYQRLTSFVLGAPPTDREIREERARSLRKPLEQQLLEKLIRGKLLATAHERPLRANADRTVIPSAHWKLLAVDFDQSTASGHGLKLVDIRVSLPKPATHPGRKPKTFTQSLQIHDAFDLLLKEGKISFARGGLAAAKRTLAEQFPTYDADSIRKIIQPAFNEAKAAHQKKKK